MKKAIVSLLLITALLLGLSGCSRTYTWSMGGDGADDDPDVPYDGPFFAGPNGGDYDEYTEWNQTIVIDPNGHRCEYNDDVGEVLREPTCYEDGLMLLYCVICGENPYECIIPSVDHDFEERYEHECGVKSMFYKTCIRCGFEKSQQLKLQHEQHSYLWDSVQHETCYQEGFMLYKCITCGHEKKEECKPIQDHEFFLMEYQSAECDQPGYAVYQCGWCEESYTEEVTVPHEYLDGYCMLCGAVEPGSGGGGGSSGGGGGSSDPTVSHFSDPTLYTANGSGKINSVTYRVEGSDLYIIIDITKGGWSNKADEFKLGWTVYGGYKKIAEGNDQTSALYPGDRELVTILVEGVITSDYSSYKVYIGYPHY